MPLFVLHNIKQMLMLKDSVICNKIKSEYIMARGRNFDKKI